jgi:hypothetical protein
MPNTLTEHGLNFVPLLLKRENASLCEHGAEGVAEWVADGREPGNAAGRLFQ